ncbi:hypothetical protein ACN28S_60375 [Cystobacter fuscus]
MRARSMRDMQMPVCREVKWGEVKVTFQERTLLLPLTERFLLRTYYLPDGAVPESNEGLWQLPMNLEQSFQRVFGFQLKAGQLQPLSDTELQSSGLMAPAPFALNRPGQGALLCGSSPAWRWGAPRSAMTSNRAECSARRA